MSGKVSLGKLYFSYEYGTILGAQVIFFFTDYRTQGLATDGGGNGGIVGSGNGFPGKNNSGGGGGGGVSLTSFVVISLISFYGAQAQTVFYAATKRVVHLLLEHQEGQAGQASLS